MIEENQGLSGRLGAEDAPTALAPPSGVEPASSLQQSRSSTDAALVAFAEDNCPGHVASGHDAKVCGSCGVHVNSFRAEEPSEPLLWETHPGHWNDQFNNVFIDERSGCFVVSERQPGNHFVTVSRHTDFARAEAEALKLCRVPA